MLLPDLASQIQQQNQEPTAAHILQKHQWKESWHPLVPRLKFTASLWLSHVSNGKYWNHQQLAQHRGVDGSEQDTDHCWHSEPRPLCPSHPKADAETICNQYPADSSMGRKPDTDQQLSLKATSSFCPSQPTGEAVTTRCSHYAAASKKLSSIFSTAATSYLTYLERFFVKLRVLYLL